jgi:hypothetical protein
VSRYECIYAVTRLSVWIMTIPAWRIEGQGSHSEDVMVERCPVGVLASGIVIEAHVCGGDSVGIGKAVLWRVQCNMARSRSNGEDIMVVRHPVRRLGIVRHNRSCMSEQWATIQRGGEEDQNKQGRTREGKGEPWTAGEMQGQ